jgi:hypothetical protein
MNELQCDCGSITFFKFGPYPHAGKIDTGLRMIYTCSKCGDQLRVYQATRMLPEALELEKEAAGE